MANLSKDPPNDASLIPAFLEAKEWLDLIAACDYAISGARAMRDEGLEATYRHLRNKIERIHNSGTPDGPIE